MGLVLSYSPAPTKTAVPTSTPKEPASFMDIIKGLIVLAILLLVLYVYCCSTDPGEMIGNAIEHQFVPNHKYTQA